MSFFFTRHNRGVAEGRPLQAHRALVAGKLCHNIFWNPKAIPVKRKKARSAHKRNAPKSLQGTPLVYGKCHATCPCRPASASLLVPLSTTRRHYSFCN